MILGSLKRLARGWSTRPSASPGEPDLLAYWEERARRHGRRAVLNMGHDEAAVEDVTRRQAATMFPYLRAMLRGDERLALDFGCGPGRFTAQLAAASGGRAVGVDPTRTLIDLAPHGPDVDYLVSDGRRIPLGDDSIDIAWVCLVLGGLPDARLPETARELDRVLRPGGLLFLVENTSDKPSSPRWAYRPVAYYRELLAFAPLDHLHDYDDLGERISIMAGRKANPAP
jgi:SAM-dependent methyltransferase